jgi:hypothetical protein
MSFQARFTRIQEPISTNRRMPRLGKIRLGVKVQTKKNGKAIEYPKETSYFVVPEEVQRVYGEQPTELDIMFPVESEDIVFPQKLAMYGRTRGLVCHGDGKDAERLNADTGKWESRTCPCDFRKTDDNPKGDCSETAHLMIILPKINVGGVYQVTTGSYNSIVDINSGMDYVRALIGRIAMVPLKLRREPTDTHHDQKKQTHYTLKVILDATIDGINKLREDSTRVLQTARYQIEAPSEEGPSVDPPDIVQEDPPEDVIEATATTVTVEEPATPEAHPDNSWEDFLIAMQEEDEGRVILETVRKRMRLSTLEHLPPEKKRMFRLTCEDLLTGHPAR